VRQSCDATEKSAGLSVLLESERDELRRLRRRIIELEIDTEVLRRAAAYFARDMIC
jgi:transposase